MTEEKAEEKVTKPRRKRRPSDYIIISYEAANPFTLMNGEHPEGERDTVLTFSSVEKAQEWLVDHQVTGMFDIACVHKRITLERVEQYKIGIRKG